MMKLDQKTLCVITHSEKLSHEISKRKHNSLDLIQNNHRSQKNQLYQTDRYYTSSKSFLRVHSFSQRLLLKNQLFENF